MNPRRLATVVVYDSIDEEQTHRIEIYDEAGCKLTIEQINMLMEAIKGECNQNEMVDTDIEVIIRKKIQPSKSMTALVYLPYYSKQHGNYKGDLEIPNWEYVVN